MRRETVHFARAINGWRNSMRWHRYRGRACDLPFGQTTGPTIEGITVRCIEPEHPYLASSSCRTPAPNWHNRIHHARGRWIATQGDYVYEHGQTYCGRTLTNPLYFDTPERDCGCDNGPASMCPLCELAFHGEGLAGACETMRREMATGGLVDGPAFIIREGRCGAMSPDTLPMFDDDLQPVTWRREDPVTSRAAGKSVNESARRAEVVTALARIGGRGTARQIHQAMTGTLMDIGSVRSRLSQMADPEGSDHRVRRTTGARVVPRSEGGTGRAEQVWAITPAGAAWLEAKRHAA